MKYILQRILENLDFKFGDFFVNGQKTEKWKDKILQKRSNRAFKRIAITGGAGFIGSHLVKFLNHSTDWEITIIDSLTYAGNLQNLKYETGIYPKFEFEKIDIRDFEKLNDFFQRKEFDAIIHLAAESHVDRSITNPLAFVETNVIGTVNLLEIALEQYRKNSNFIFYHVSTDEVFGSLDFLDNKKFDEETSYDPRSPYSASKASSDHFVRAYHHTYNLPVIISNCSNNYGTHQYPEKLIPLMVEKLKKRESLPIYGDGLNERDWIYVLDHAKAIKEILIKGKIGETYCIGGENVIRNIDLINKICDLYDNITGEKDSRKLITYIKDRKGHDKKYAINSSKMKYLIGWNPEQPFESGIRKTIKWYIEE